MTDVERIGWESLAILAYHRKEFGLAYPQATEDSFKQRGVIATMVSFVTNISPRGMDTLVEMIQWGIEEYTFERIILNHPDVDEFRDPALLEQAADNLARAHRRAQLP